TALRIALYHLRHTLEVGTGPEHTPHLLIQHEMLGLDPGSSIDLDLHALREAWSLARNRTAREEAQGEARRAMIDRLQHAVALYRGSFLEDFTLRDTVDFDNWMGIQRNYWYQRIEQIFDWLSQLLSVEGAFERAIATVERWRSLDPLNEDVSLRLMQLQLASGNRVAALKTYESTVEVLMEELSAKPSPKLAALAEFIRNAPAHRVALKRKQTGPSSSRSLLAVPFVGREVEMGMLMSLYEKASRGQPQVVVIEGEAGIGKSRLAATFLDWARAQGADVLAGRAFHSHQHLAYQPLVDPLRERLAREPDLRRLLSDTWLAELSRLLPDLRERYPDLPPASVDEVFEAPRFLEALGRLDQALAGRATLLVFIDDLQWTDRATLDVFQYLGMQWAKRSTPVMVLLSRRVETRSADPWLNEWFARLKNDLPVTRLGLRPLSAKDTLQIVRSVSGEDSEQDDGQSQHSTLPSTSRAERAASGETGAERLSRWLYAETKGQPFFVRTTLEAMLRRGVLVPRLVKGRGWVFEPQEAALRPEVLGSILPSDVREAIQRRLAQLSPPARELLVAGAVLDHDFTFEFLSQVAQLTTQEALTALDEALESLLLQESQRHSEGREVPAYTFAHDKIREVVYAGAGNARSRIFHARAVEVLERAGASAAELAY
ncbi:MAG TPA: AAA family ATPase, partial [Ktedonobacteraceae bacterium]|nr:AAA family ATPase [Ktedonobacteraceae bacterium]